MKRKLLITFISALFLLAFFAGSALATDSTDANADGYNDNDFNKIQTFLNLASANPAKLNGEVINASYDAADPATWTGVTWSSDASKCVTEISWNSLDLKGALNVSAFTSLTKLICCESYLSEIDVTGNSALSYIDISYDALATLDLSTCANLQELYCQNNHIDVLTLTGLANLTTLTCSENKLETLSVGTNVNLDYLDCEDNALTSLDLSANTKLVELYCGKNALTSLDVKNHASLTTLLCDLNKLTTIDFSGCTGLQILYCPDNDLSGTLDLRSLDNLQIAIYDENNLTSVITGTRFYAVITGASNPITFITSNIFTPNQNFSVSGDGYIDFEASSLINVALLYAEGHSNSVFYNWTINGVEISKSPIHFINPSNPETGDIVANFKPGLTSSLPKNVVYEGAKFIVEPLFEGGEWKYDTDFLKADFSDPGSVVFTVLKNGNTTIHYILPEYEYEETPQAQTGSLQTNNTDDSSSQIQNYINGEVSALDEEASALDEQEDPYVVTMDITIKETLLPQTGQSFTTSIVFAAFGITVLSVLLAIGTKKRKNA